MNVSDHRFLTVNFVSESFTAARPMVKSGKTWIYATRRSRLLTFHNSVPNEFLAEKLKLPYSDKRWSTAMEWLIKNNHRNNFFQNRFFPNYVHTRCSLSQYCLRKYFDSDKPFLYEHYLFNAYLVDFRANHEKTNSCNCRSTWLTRETASATRHQWNSEAHLKQ